MIRSIERRAADIVSLSTEGVEPLQIVAYTSGQQFTLHHDAGTLDVDERVVETVTPCRLVTFFIYLNDLPPGEGETLFPYLNNLAVRPVRGTALLFSNLLPSGGPDLLTSHQANPVHGNIWKYGVNLWIANTSMLDIVEDKPRSRSKKSNDVMVPFSKTALYHADEMLRRVYVQRLNNYQKV